MIVRPGCKPLLWLATIFLAAVLSQSAGAQPHPVYPGVRLARLDYTNASGEDGESVFHYDRYGVLRVSLWTLRDGSRFSLGQHLYDAAGRETTKRRRFSDDLTSEETYRYDGQGRLLEEAFSRSDGKSGTATFGYDPQGRLLTMTCRGYKGWLDAEITFTREDGRLAAGILTREGAPLGTITYTHDEMGHLRRAHWDFGGRWSQTFEYVWEPVPEICPAAANPWQQQNTRFRVVGEDYDWNQGENGGPSTYRYAAGGLLEEKVFRRSDGLSTTTTYTFDGRGDLLSSRRVYHDGRTADFTYHQDEQGRLTEKTFTRSDGARGREAYRYDEWGMLATVEYENMDFWLNGTITLEHDGLGRLTGGVFRGRDGYDAALTMATDAHGNVTRVHWDFSFGKTQTYTFVYEEWQP